MNVSWNGEMFFGGREGCALVCGCGRFELFYPVDEEGGSGGVASEGADGRHLALSARRASQEEDGGGGIAWGKDSGVVDAERGVQGDGFECRVFFGQSESELHVGISASATDMAMGAVGVQIGAGSVVQRSGGVCGIGEWFGCDGRFWEQDAVLGSGALQGRGGHAGEALLEDGVAGFVFGEFGFPFGDMGNGLVEAESSIGLPFVELGTSVAIGPGELHAVHGEGEAGLAAVTDAAFLATRKDPVSGGDAFLREEFGVGLGVVPLVGIAGPLVVLFEQDACFEAFLFSREGLDEGGAVGEFPRAVLIELDAGAVGEGEEVFGVGVIVPTGSVDEVGEDAARGGKGCGVGEEPRFAEFCGEWGGRSGGWGSSFEAMDGVAAVVHEMDFTVV